MLEVVKRNLPRKKKPTLSTLPEDEELLETFGTKALREPVYTIVYTASLNATILYIYSIYNISSCLRERAFLSSGLCNSLILMSFCHDHVLYKYVGSSVKFFQKI